MPFGKSCNKLLDVNCITLNSPFISRMNSVKIINNYSIITQRKQNNTKISKTNTQVFPIKKKKKNTQVSFLHNTNISKYKTKLQMTYWINHLIKNKNI